MIGEFTKECLFIDVAGSIRGKKVVEVLQAVATERGYPKYLLSDNGPEFVSTVLLDWAVRHGDVKHVDISRQALADRYQREF